MIYIAEGIERSGKTTFCENSGLYYFSMKDKTVTKFIEKPEDYYHGVNNSIIEVIRMCCRYNIKICIDRFILSELVYSNFYNRKTYVYHIIQELSKIKNINILLFNSITFEEYMNRKPKKLYTKNEFEEIKSLFDHYFHLLKKELKNISFERK